MPRPTLDARPDRVDFRDRPYRPPLVSLEPRFPTLEDLEKYLPAYEQANLILDQGKEGACTGFGLAAVINYLLWRRDPNAEPTRVSMRMLYQLARIYDEWPGEDYEGSSCRGAMKGWHRHGVTTDEIWRYKEDGAEDATFIPPKRGWQQDAAKRPLGAYYRIDRSSISDMQAAIQEVGAIYCSADVHEGWFLETCQELPVMKIGPRAGGHAFAIVGYDMNGFIVQNSWGPGWGWHGFAVMTYHDWVDNGADAWAVVLGAPMAGEAPRARVTLPLGDESCGQSDRVSHGVHAPAGFTYADKTIQPLAERDAVELGVVLGNDGRPLNRLVDAENAPAAVKETCFELPLRSLKDAQSPRIAIYAHGGLNDESDSRRRIRIMAPYFLQNGIYPLFITWKTGLGESIHGMISDSVASFFGADDVRAAGWLDKAKAQIAEARDRAIEVACENLLIKPVWSQMKQNAWAAAREDSGLHQLAHHLRALNEKIPELEIHLVGHSAGSIVHGHLLGLMEKNGLEAKTATLYAPACTVAFANERYGAAVRAGVLANKALHLDVLTEDRERADTVGPYGKSLLYLVSRALESSHKTPLLGMEAALDAKFDTDSRWNERSGDDLGTWRAFAKDAVEVRTHGGDRTEAKTGAGSIPLAHGSFDNDIEVVTDTLVRIRGGKKLDKPVVNLASV